MEVLLDNCWTIVGIIYRLTTSGDPGGNRTSCSIDPNEDILGYVRRVKIPAVQHTSLIYLVQFFKAAFNTAINNSCSMS